MVNLEEAGWIRSQKSPDHWSAICYYITDEGERVCKLLLQIRDGGDPKTDHVLSSSQEDSSVTGKDE